MDSKIFPFRRNGFTLVELLFSTLLLVALVETFSIVYRVLLLNWSTEEQRGGISININRGLEELSRDLREARQIQAGNSNSEIRFSPDLSNYYIYYLYNANNTYPPTYNQSSYQFKKETLAGGINGTFTYGSGAVIVNDVVPPPTTVFSVSGKLATIDLQAQVNDEIIRVRTDVKARGV